MEEYDDYEASEWFGDEDVWDIYKKYSKYKKPLLEAMDNFYKQKSYLLSRPDLYYPDGYHPNRVIHKDLAKKIAKKVEESYSNGRYRK